MASHSPGPMSTCLKASCPQKKLISIPVGNTVKNGDRGPTSSQNLHRSDAQYWPDNIEPSSHFFAGYLLKWNESGFRPPLCTYRLNWARRTSWGWWDDWDDTALQTQDSKFEPWRSEAEHATSRSRRLPTILTFTRGWGRNGFVSFKPPRPGTEPRTLAWKAAVLTTTLGPPPGTCSKASAQTSCRLGGLHHASSPYSCTSYDISKASDWSRWPSRPICSLRYIVTNCTRIRAPGARVIAI